MIPRPFAEGADPEFYLFGNGRLEAVSKWFKMVNAVSSVPVRVPARKQ